MYLTTTIGRVLSHDAQCVYTDANAARGYSQFYNDLKTITTTLDWDLLRAQYWKDREASDEVNAQRVAKRQAELLVHEFCPWTVFDEVVTVTPDVACHVEALFDELRPRHRPLVTIRPEWFAG